MVQAATSNGDYQIGTFLPQYAGRSRIQIIIVPSRRKILSFRERRRAKRFNFEVPLTVRWTEGSVPRKAHTISQDVSSGGVYFFLPAGIPEGTAIEVEMTLPAEITLGEPVRVRCQGRIKRCLQKTGEAVGMATAIEKYEFLAGTKDAA
jgi:hypothetical protein